MSIISTDPDCYKDKLIRNVKKEVKQIMEEAVTRKFVHEDSSSITSLCAAVEACLSQGLRRRALGLFKTSSTTALLHKAGKSFGPAGIISLKVQEIENSDPNRRSSSSGDSTNRLLANKPPLIKKNSAGGMMSGGSQNSATPVAPPTPRYLWLRLALFEKQLAKIIDHLVQNSSKYYEKDSLVADPDYGSILSSLLVGPCALDYSRTKTQDHFWTDPPADELVQRHRISGGHSSTTPPACRRPALNFRRSLHGVNSAEEIVVRPVSTNTSAKEYVESLHQNSRATLLYGKNNVMVLPKDLTEPMPGYLSLHQSANALTIKWTPNQLMNGYNEAPNDTPDKRRSSLPARGNPPLVPVVMRRHSASVIDYLFWDYALHVSVDDIVYVHCHQQADSGGTVVLVGQDGVQRPPIHFPRGGHLLAFLSCLETGLLPHGQLDPPLWSQRGKGKVFPRLRRKARAALEKPSLPHNGSSEEECEASDYVFRIISKAGNHEDLCTEWFFPRSPVPPSPGTRSSLFSSSTASSTSSSKSLSLDGVPIPPEPSPPPAPKPHPKLTAGDSIQILCDTMKRQIISRAFYGWLAYCRHLTTVRTHLSGLVHTTIVSATEPKVASGGLTEEIWRSMQEGTMDQDEVFRLTYYGGVAHSIRKEVWPYLLGHIAFDSSPEQREEQDKSVRRAYETTMSEWLAVEAIVRQRDKEAMAATLAKLSSESTSNAGDAPPPAALNTELSNDVFEDSEDDSECCCDDTENEVQVNPAPTTREGRRPTLCPPNSLEKPDESQQQPPEPHKLLQGVVGMANGGPNHQNSEERAASPDEGVGEELDENGSATVEEPVTPASITNGTAEPVVVTTNPSVDSGNQSEPTEEMAAVNGSNLQGGIVVDQLNGGVSPGSRSGAVSPASSQGGVYSTELLETFGLNLHRIDKDVQRCDRNYWYFSTDNLDKLRNVMCTYVWEHLDIGYMQGMCDLVAPLLVIMDDEALSYACFCRLMDRMAANFPHGGAMDAHFANMRSLIQILDSEMFELMHQHGDYTHFYFCYRWFLLDFKRELLYDDVFSVWETIWASKHVASPQFGLFLALALVETYREIILGNSMDFTDIIKFFNEMAERHDAKAVLNLSRELVLQLQTLIENK